MATNVFFPDPIPGSMTMLKIECPTHGDIPFDKVQIYQKGGEGMASMNDRQLHCLICEKPLKVTTGDEIKKTASVENVQAIDKKINKLNKLYYSLETDVINLQAAFVGLDAKLTNQEKPKKVNWPSVNSKITGNKNLTTRVPKDVALALKLKKGDSLKWTFGDGTIEVNV